MARDAGPALLFQWSVYENDVSIATAAIAIAAHQVLNAFQLSRGTAQATHSRPP